MPSGGRRPGAGRKPKAEQFARPIAAAEKQICDRLPWLIDRAFIAAGGIQERVPVLDEVTGKPLTVIRRDPATDEPVLGLDGLPLEDVVTELAWKVLPNIKAIAYLVDRIMGRVVPATTGADSAAVDIRAAVGQTQAAAKAYQDPPAEESPDATI